MRASIKDVSEDEEAMNLAKYQKSYNAAARYMTVLDEMIDLIVSRMGIVGR
jgi:flagellar hook-associated protein 1 FlgK